GSGVRSRDDASRPSPLSLSNRRHPAMDRRNRHVASSRSTTAQPASTARFGATDAIPPPSRMSDWSPSTAQEWGTTRAIAGIEAGITWYGIMQPPSAPSASPANTPIDDAWSPLRASAPTSIAAAADTRQNTATIAAAASGSPQETPNTRVDTAM